MRIKRLDIQGFKSFADPIAVHFDSGVTGVVGPNGCGKSNIVDALRWAMGEMSAKHLRGGNMQDVIFNGSESRGPTGMAEVSLTFENDGANLPPEYASYSEIQVTRRLYRSGDSEYEINKTPCRLRDITDLFLGTGIGTKAYSIIEQGRVGQIVSAKAEDRRRIIEEAAGITKYKARRLAAERKMEATRQNLLRVTDVTAEVQKRLGSLKRQAQKAARYKKLKGELKHLELHNASLTYLETHSRLGFERSAHQRAEEDLVLAQARLAEVEAKIETARLQLIDDERTLAESQARVYEVDNNLALLEQQQSHAVQSIQASRQREVEAKEEIQRLTGQMDLLAEESAGFSRDRELLQQGALEDEQRLEEAVRSHEDLQRQRETAAGEVEQVRQEMVEAASSAAQLQADIQAVENRRVEVAQRIAKLEAEREALLAKIEGVERQSGIIREEIAGHRRRENELSQGVEAGRVALVQAKERLEKHEEARLDFKAGLNKEQSRLSSLQEIAHRFERAPAGVRAAMQAHNEKQEVANGVVGLMADLFEAPEDLEKVLESALSETLQTVVVERTDHALGLGKWLAAEDSGRATFLVEAGLPENPKSLPEVPVDVGTPLFPRLRMLGEHEKAVRHALGQVVLVPGEEQARNLWHKAQQEGWTLITRGGEVYRPEGTLSVGATSDDAAGLLHQKREIRELEGKVRQLEDELATMDQKRAELAGEVERLSTEQEDSVEKRQRLAMTIVKLEGDLDRIGEEDKHLKSRLETVGNERGELDDGSQDVADKLAAMQELWAENLDAAAHREDALAQATARLEAVEKSLKERGEEVSDLRVKVAAATERRENLLRSLAHHERSQQEISLRVETLIQQIKSGEAERDELEARIQDTKGEQAEMAQQRQVLNDDLLEKRKTYEEDAETVQSQEGEARVLRGELEQDREVLAERALRIKEFEMNLQALIERIWDRYEVQVEEVLFDYHMGPMPADGAAELIDDLRRKISGLGEVNLTAVEEYDELSERYEFLKQQTDDLTHALTQLERAIAKINRTTKKRFEEAFEAINERFQQVFPRLFRGGKAWLALTNPDDLLATGVEIYAQPPGKKLGSVALMSGGEKALTAVSLIFAIFLIKPSPFCLLDEVDAPLDEANVARFSEVVKEMSGISQFIVITHNKRTMEVADHLYGITMEEPGISKTVNVRIKRGAAEESAEEVVAAE
jgi:chromosome segregation protein